MPIELAELAQARAALVNAIAHSVELLRTNLEAAALFLQGPEAADVLADMRTALDRADRELAKLRGRRLRTRRRHRLRALHQLANAIHILAAGVAVLFWYLPPEAVFMAQDMEEAVSRTVRQFQTLRSVGV